MSSKPNSSPPKKTAPSAERLHAQTELAKIQSRDGLLHHLIDQISQILVIIIRACLWITITYYLYQAVGALAGRQTNADLSLDLRMMASRHTATIFGWAFGIFGCGYGLQQRKLYRKTSAHLKRIGQLEKKIDSNRSSSGLKDGWKPNDEDI